MMEERRKPRKTHKQRVRERRIKKVIALLLILGVVGTGFVIRHVKYANLIVVGLDAGHGGEDPGAEGLIEEAVLTEQTVKQLESLLEEDGRFRVVLSRHYGDGKSIAERKKNLLKYKPQIILSVHANADDLGQGTGFECYPSPPGRANHDISYQFAQILGEEMAKQGSKLRGTDGIRYCYYVPTENGESKKVIVEVSDTTVYEYSSLGMVEGMSCPSVLVEQCFVTNQADVEAFGTEEGSQKAAQAYYEAICRYLALPVKTE